MKVCAARLLCCKFSRKLLGALFGSVATVYDKVVWFLLGKDEASMNKWMTAINAQIHSLFIKMYNVPDDDYWSQG